MLGTAAPLRIRACTAEPGTVPGRQAGPSPGPPQPHRHGAAQGRTVLGHTRPAIAAEFTPAYAGSRGRTFTVCPNPTCGPRVFRPILLLGTAVETATSPPLATCEERTVGHVWLLRRRGRDGMRTSQWRHRMERFVIECFTPSCHVDIASSVELVPPATSDTVDSILAFAAGETCRTERTRRLRGADFR